MPTEQELGRSSLCSSFHWQFSRLIKKLSSQPKVDEQKSQRNEMNEFKLLSEKSKERQKTWDPEGKISADSEVGNLFRTVETMGEIGELANIIKKLERERLGIQGSRASLQDLKEEIADGVITLSNLADNYDIDLWEAVRMKFNKTSDAQGFDVKI